MRGIDNNSRAWGGFDWGSWNEARAENPPQQRETPAQSSANQDDRVETTPKPLLSLSDGPGLLLLADEEGPKREATPAANAPVAGLHPVEGEPGARQPVSDAPALRAARIPDAWTDLLTRSVRSLEPQSDPGVAGGAAAARPTGEAALDEGLNRLVAVSDERSLRSETREFVRENGQAKRQLREVLEQIELLEQRTSLNLQTEWPQLALFKTVAEGLLSGGEPARWDESWSRLREALGSGGDRLHGCRATRSERQQVERGLDALRGAFEFDRALVAELPQFLFALGDPRERKAALSRMGQAAQTLREGSGDQALGSATGNGRNCAPPILEALERLSSAVGMLEIRRKLVPETSAAGREAPLPSGPPALASARAGGLPVDEVQRILSEARTELRTRPDGKTTLLGHIGLKASGPEKLAQRARERAAYAEDELLNALGRREADDCIRELRGHLLAQLTFEAMDAIVLFVNRLPSRERQELSPALAVLLEPAQPADAREAALRTLCGHREGVAGCFAEPRALLAALDGVPKLFATFGDREARAQALLEWGTAVSRLPEDKKPLLQAAERLNAALERL